MNQNSMPSYNNLVSSFMPGGSGGGGNQNQASCRCTWELIDLASQLGLGTANNGGGNGSGMVLNAASSGSLAPG
jgi:hypothetical protein